MADSKKISSGHSKLCLRGIDNPKLYNQKQLRLHILLIFWEYFVRKVPKSSVFNREYLENSDLENRENHENQIMGQIKKSCFCGL